MNNQDKINKIITVLDTLLAKCPNTTTQQQQEQQTLADLVNKLKQEEIKDLEALENLGGTFLQEKTNWLSEKTALEKAKKDAETALATEKKKLGEDLVAKLEALAKGKDGELSEEAKAEFKKIADTLKDTKTEVSLTEADTKKLATELKKEQPINYWVIAACVMGGLSLIASLFLVVKKTTEEK